MTDQNPIPTVAKSATTEAQYTGTHSSDCRCHLCVTPDKDQCSKVGIAIGLPWERPNDRCQRPVWKDGLCWFHHPDGKPKKSATTEPVKDSLTVERLKELNENLGSAIRWATDELAAMKLRAEKAEYALNVILGTEPRYKGIRGTQHDGTDVDLDVCSLCGYADGHEERCPIPIIEEKEDESESKLQTAERERDEARAELVMFKNDEPKKKIERDYFHGGRDKALADLEEVMKERDALRAENERLKRKQVPQPLKEIKPDESENARLRERFSVVADASTKLVEIIKPLPEDSELRFKLIQEVCVIRNEAALAGKGEK